MGTCPIENLQEQLLVDMARFGELMNQYANGNTSVKQERDQLEGAVEIKLAILEGLRRLEEIPEIEDDWELEDNGLENGW